MDKACYDMLTEKAVGMRKMSYCPYSGFSVGAALLCKDGTVYTGCNIENQAFGSTICAERTAIFKAISEGNKEFAAICIAGGEKDIAVYLIANENAVGFYEKLGMKKADDVMQYNHIEWTEFTVE